MKTGLQIAFLGSSLVSAYWNGAATYYRGLIRALHARGHQSTFYEPDAYSRQQHRDIPDPSWAHVVVYPASTEGLERALWQARNADLIIKASGVGVFDAELEAMVIGLRKPGNLIAFWDVDAPATLERIYANPIDPFRSHIPRYDLIFTYGGGDAVIQAYTALGARVCVPIYNALDVSTHYPVAPDPRFAGDLGFLGNRMPDREARVAEFFLQPAAHLSHRVFLLGGNGWGDAPLPPNVTYHGHVYTYDHNAFNSTPRFILNINRASMAHYGFSPPTRIFEAAGAGACVMSDAWPGIELFLEPEREVLLARNGAEVAAYLEMISPERARAIGQAAYARIQAEHTYEQRANQFEAVLAAHCQANQRSTQIQQHHRSGKERT